MSPPAWRRGLKPFPAFRMAKVSVASRVEAWIETQRKVHGRRFGVVASRVEAWIETLDPNNGYNGGKVASRVEAWIETA